MTASGGQVSGGEWGASCQRPMCHWITREEGYATRGEAMNALHKHICAEHPKESA